MDPIEEATFSATDGLVLFGTGVVLPTGDIYSDISLVVLLCSIKDDPYPDPNNIIIFIGKIMIIPLILNTLFIMPHWLNCEKTFERRVVTFPLVLFQLYPQYRSMRIIWLAFVKKNVTKCLKEKLLHESSTSNVGKLICYQNILIISLLKT